MILGARIIPSTKPENMNCRIPLKPHRKIELTLRIIKGETMKAANILKEVTDAGKPAQTLPYAVRMISGIHAKAKCDLSMSLGSARIVPQGQIIVMVCQAAMLITRKSSK
jgi:hypothetical protein